MGARILIVEYDADINEIIAVHLARQGHTCTQAYSGTEGIMRLGGELASASATRTGPGETGPTHGPVPSAQPGPTHGSAPGTAPSTHPGPRHALSRYPASPRR